MGRVLVHCRVKRTDVILRLNEGQVAVVSVGHKYMMPALRDLQAFGSCTCAVNI